MTFAQLVPLVWTTLSTAVLVFGGLWYASKRVVRWDGADVRSTATQHDVAALSGSVAALQAAVASIKATQADIQDAQRQAASAHEQAKDNAGKLDAIYRELTVNGGETVKDRVVQLAQQMTDHGRRMADHVTRDDQRHEEIDRRLDELTRTVQRYIDRGG